MEFERYQHVERFGRPEVENIEIGTCYVFPKIDGTNASVWIDDIGNFCAGSRNRQLELGDDNAGFYQAMILNTNISNYLIKNPTHRLYGEWLVPHSLKNYKEDAWRKFYIFDVVESTIDGYRYLTYEEYQPLLEMFGLEYIPPLKKITNGTYDDFLACAQNNTYLIKDGMGNGEGVVIKNYDYVNRYGRVTWAKIVLSEFKTLNIKTFGAPSIEKNLIEMDMAEKYVTQALVDKVYANIVVEKGMFENKDIPRLLNTVFHDVVVEDTWDFISKNKIGSLNFNTLKGFVFSKVKQLKPEVF